MFYTERAKGIVEEIIHKHTGNDGWIPVEEHLPEDGQIVIISMYNNIKWVTIEVSAEEYGNHITT